jgi:hypothetical protein
LYIAFALFLGLAALAFIKIDRSDNFSESDNQSRKPIKIKKSHSINERSPSILPRKKIRDKNVQSAEKIIEPDILEIENPDESLEPVQHVNPESTIEGVGLLEQELRRLHADQRHKIAQMYRDMDSIVIGSDKDNNTVLTLGDVLALHRQQRHAMEITDDSDEIVIPSLNDGDPDRTKAEIIELHQQQRLATGNLQDWDQIVIPDSGDGLPALSWDEVATLQEQQADEMWEKAEDPHAPGAPFAEDGGPDMTLQELKNLHMKQLAK